MKKLISFILCLSCAVFVLAGCSEDIIGEYLENYEKPVQKEKISINLHIICEDDTSKNAQITVAQRIADYTAGKYDTTVNVIYSYADDYEATLDKAISDKEADIVLINSKSMMDKLYEERYLADLTEYLAGNTYGTLNARIAKALLDAYKTETLVNESIEDRLYCVPNNHIVGQYKYIVVNRDVAEYFYKGSPAELAKFDNEEVYEDFKAIVSEPENWNQLINKGLVEADASVDDYVNIVSGMYQNKAIWESRGYACNILEMPAVDTDNCFSAFGIIADTYNVDRAMEILYAVNTDETLHNYLLYGIVGTNYKLTGENNDTVVRESDEENKNSFYRINPLYAGDIFASYYCEELGWNKEAEIYGTTQNLEAVYLKPEITE